MKKIFIVTAVLIIVAGASWLMNSLQVMPGVDWMWVGWVGVCGLLILLLGGMNKVSAVLGPFLIVAAVVSIFEQTGQLKWKFAIPTLVIVFGVLLLLVTLTPLKLPKCLDEREGKKEAKTGDESR